MLADKINIINQIKAKQTEIKRMTLQVDTLIAQLDDISDDDWDWVTVKQTADRLGCSVSLIYSLINSGKLECKRISSKMYVRKSQVEKLDE